MHTITDFKQTLIYIRMFEYKECIYLTNLLKEEIILFFVRGNFLNVLDKSTDLYSLHKNQRLKNGQNLFRY